MPVKFSLVSGSPDVGARRPARRRPCSPTASSAPAPTRSTAAVGGGLRDFMEETGFEGKPGETLAIPTNGALGARWPRSSSAWARATSSPLDGSAPRAALRSRDAGSKVASVATTLLDAAPESIDRADAAQALVEGVALGSYKFLRYKGEGKPSKLESVKLIGRGGARHPHRRRPRRARSRRRSRGRATS